MHSVLSSINDIFEKGFIVQFASNPQQLTITAENIQYDCLVGYQEISFAISKLNFNNQQYKVDQEEADNQLLPYGLQENFEQLKIDQYNLQTEEGEVKFDQCHFKSVLESKKQIKNISQNDDFSYDIYQNSDENILQEALNNLSNLIMNLLTKEITFNTTIDFQHFREFLTKDIVSFKNIKFIESQRLYHVFDYTQVENQFINNSNKYSFLISLIERRNLALHLENLDVVIECQNIKYHPQESNWFCYTCFDIERKEIKGSDYFSQRVFDLKNIKTQKLNIYLIQDIPIFHDIIVHHTINKVRIQGQQGFGVNFVFKNNSHINIVEWDVELYSLPSTIYLLEHCFQGRIGHTAQTIKAELQFSRSFRFYSIIGLSSYSKQYAHINQASIQILVL
ncbi:hypothetical protein TTHERM_00876890 (macronuclear) [Tetrahymena thermophila SB210]|uniref:Uncharacterized protein n=1 Tax=Tetrahymena thermophila (strain SB210) TaxID=312017 RepID=Q23H53_TETTS|nr:hypothetical protein TTHERM_00876890 [Tetrahymena thermophila SB210]EAR95794.2 hypothetical protein TTHERM_00876890 [Tetrahymena thermophila SB210]|eukprot:XP_001016039.2 hypothetical protein TTHERM_00876890 [Tetrahymena thermophila SB210]